MQIIKVVQQKNSRFQAFIPNDPKTRPGFGGEAAYAVIRLIMANPERFQLKIELPPDHQSKV